MISTAAPLRDVALVLGHDDQRPTPAQQRINLAKICEEYGNLARPVSDDLVITLVKRLRAEAGYDRRARHKMKPFDKVVRSLTGVTARPLYALMREHGIQVHFPHSPHIHGRPAPARRKSVWTNPTTPPAPPLAPSIEVDVTAYQVPLRMGENLLLAMEEASLTSCTPIEGIKVFADRYGHKPSRSMVAVQLRLLAKAGRLSVNRGSPREEFTYHQVPVAFRWPNGRISAPHAIPGHVGAKKKLLSTSAKLKVMPIAIRKAYWTVRDRYADRPLSNDEVVAFAEALASIGFRHYDHYIFPSLAKTLCIITKRNRHNVSKLINQPNVSQELKRLAGMAAGVPRKTKRHEKPSPVTTQGDEPARTPPRALNKCFRVVVDCSTREIADRLATVVKGISSHLAGQVSVEEFVG